MAENLKQIKDGDRIQPFKGCQRLFSIEVLIRTKVFLTIKVGYMDFSSATKIYIPLYAGGFGCRIFLELEKHMRLLFTRLESMGHPHGLFFILLSFPNLIFNKVVLIL